MSEVAEASAPTEAEDLLAVRLRHRGQCPHPRGHTFEAVMNAVVVTAALTTVLLGLLAGATLPNREKEAILRGYATRDPITYEFRWK